MSKKLTLSVSDAFYEGLYSVAGKGNIGHYIEEMLSPHILQKDIDLGYAAMAKDEQQNKEAEEWCENLLGENYQWSVVMFGG